MIVLPGLDQSYPLKISLQLITDLERVHGSIYGIAEKLLEETLTLSAMMGILKTLYRHAGCESTEEALEEIVLRETNGELLATVLLDILAPIERLGALTVS